MNATVAAERGAERVTVGAAAAGLLVLGALLCGLVRLRCVLFRRELALGGASFF